MREFENVSDFDENGIVFYMGTLASGDGETFADPTDKTIQVKTSHAMNTGSKNTILDRSGARKYTYFRGGPPNWVQFDFGDHSVRPRAITMRHGWKGGSFRLNNWGLDGSKCLWTADP